MFCFTIGSLVVSVHFGVQLVRLSLSRGRLTGLARSLTLALCRLLFARFRELRLSTGKHEQRSLSAPESSRANPQHETRSAGRSNLVARVAFALFAFGAGQLGQRTQRQRLGGGGR